MARRRGWVFTLNNYTDEELQHIKSLEGTVKYLVIGLEKGEKEETPHIQGYIELNNAKTLNAMKEFVSMRAHFEPRMGTFEQAADYSKKDGIYFEYGELPQQGKRSDLVEVAKLVRDGNLKKAIDEYPISFIKYSRGVFALHHAHQQPRDKDHKCTVIWLWGATGVGKTRTAVESHDTYYIKDGTQWWDGYDQEIALIIDDFDGRWPFRDLLRLLDRYPYQGQVKGGYVHINSPYIYITCDRPPDAIWYGDELRQMERRIDEIRHLEPTSAYTEVAGNTNPPHFCAASYVWADDEVYELLTC